jgi:hypothetical protein
MGKGLEVVKRSARDEQMWVVIHMCMETTLGISLYSYLYPKLAKTLCLSYYLLCFLFNKIGEQDCGTGSAQKWGWGVGEVDQTMYSHVSKCKNDKIKNLQLLYVLLVGLSKIISSKLLAI